MAIVSTSSLRSPPPVITPDRQDHSRSLTAADVLLLPLPLSIGYDEKSAFYTCTLYKVTISYTRGHVCTVHVPTPSRPATKTLCLCQQLIFMERIRFPLRHRAGNQINVITYLFFPYISYSYGDKANKVKVRSERKCKIKNLYIIEFLKIKAVFFHSI